ncbi:MAG: hypothetical protein ACREKS_08975 [Candidatus Rokuibacteriota bacterium]
MLKSETAQRWAEARERLLGLPLDIVPADRELAGAIKTAERMSLADCFAGALQAAPG